MAVPKFTGMANINKDRTTKEKVKSKNKDIKKRFLEEIMISSLNLSELNIEVSRCYK